MIITRLNIWKIRNVIKTIIFLRWLRRCIITDIWEIDKLSYNEIFIKNGGRLHYREYYRNEGVTIKEKMHA